MMETATLLALSLVSCVLGFALEMTRSNIRHVQNGRTPNAGVALLPNIPFVQIGYLAAAWGIDRLRPDLGFEIVTAYAVVPIMWRWFLYRRSAASLKATDRAAA
jgi:hypothetical protein